MENINDRVGAGLALLVALPEEARGILRAGDWQRVPSSASLATYRGHMGGSTVTIAVSGVGKAPAEATTREVIAQQHPEAIISLGFAGGLVEGQEAGDMVVAKTLSPVDNGSNRTETSDIKESLASDEALANQALRVLMAQGLRSQAGACLTVSQIVSRPEDKSALGRDTGALAVEEESFWIGRVSHEHAIPFLAVRAIVDAAGHPLPGFVAEFAFESRLKSRWRQALPVLFRPWWIPGLIRLGAAATRAQRSLTAFTLAFLESYAQEPVAPATVEPG